MITLDSIAGIMNAAKGAPVKKAARIHASDDDDESDTEEEADDTSDTNTDTDEED